MRDFTVTAPTITLSSAKRAAKLSVGIPASPAPTVHPPANTPPDPINNAPNKYCLVCLWLLKDTHWNSFFKIEDMNEPTITPPIRPTPNPAGIDVEAIDQNNKSELGEVNDNDWNGIGSNSSNKINPVPIQESGISKPMNIAKIKWDIFALDL